MGKAIFLALLIGALFAIPGHANLGIGTRAEQAVITFQPQPLGDPIGCVYLGDRFLVGLSPEEVRAGRAQVPQSELEALLPRSGEFSLFVFLEGTKAGARLRADEGARFSRHSGGPGFDYLGEAVPNAALRDLIARRYRELREIRARIAAQRAEWTADVNPVFMLPDAERFNMLGALVPPGDAGIPPLRVSDGTPAPDSLDWTRMNGKNYITGIRNQASCGSCWAFGAVAQVEALVNVAEDDTTIDLNLSEQTLVSDCCTSCGDCGGGWHSTSLSYIRTTGIPTEACFPYRGANSTCSRCSTWLAEARKINTVSTVTSQSQNETAIKNALQNHPLSTTVYVDNTFQAYHGGIYSYLGSVNDINHVVLLVGWGGSDTSQAYWKLKNSWGASWGEQGYMRARRGQNNLLGYYTMDATYLPLFVDAGRDTTLRAPRDTLTLAPTVRDGAPCYDPARPSYTYAWSPRTGLSDSTLKNPRAYPATTTTYRLTVRDLNLSRRDSLRITVVPYGVEALPAGPAPEFGLAQNQPNPFLGRTSIAYSLPAPGRVVLRIYDISGRCIKTLVDQAVGAGAHTAWWDGTNASGGKTGIGIYFYRLESGGRTSLRKIIRL
jgi:Papain family cysteine protease/FlgD Ig-like domain